MSRSLNFEQVRRNYLRDLQNQNPDAHVHAGSDNHVRATAIAAMAEGQYQHQEWILRQAFADTADSAHLEKHAAKYGIYRKPSTTAGGQVRVSGASGTMVPVGQMVRVGEVIYVTTERVVIGPTGSAVVACGASNAGSAYNQPPNRPAVLVSPPAGADGAAVLVSMVGGTDTESDDHLLDRYEERLRRPAAGGNQYDFRRWCLEVPGVVDAYIYPLRRGNGFVDAVILGEQGIPSQETLAAVQAHVDALRPVTRLNGFLAMAPSIQAVDIRVSITLAAGIDQAAVRADIEAAIKTYFNAIKPGETLIRSRLEMLISEVYGVVDRDLITPAANVVPQESPENVYWLRAGSISVEYTS